MKASNTPHIANMALRATPLALAIALLASCGGGGADTPLADSASARTPLATKASVAGLVEAGSRVEGASVTLRRLGPDHRDGEAPVDAGASNGAGAFVLDVSRVSGQAEAVATGGMVKGQAFNGTLRARLDRRAPDSMAPIAINIPTTLVATVMERHPSLPMVDAEALVRQALGLPEGMPLDTLGSAFDLFDDTAFLQAAQAAGGFDAYMVAVSQKVLNREAVVVPAKAPDSEQAATQERHTVRAMAAVPVGRADDRVSAMALGGEATELAAGDLAGWAGKQFAGQVAGRAINMGLSVALSQAGISLPGSSDSGLAEIKQALDKLRVQIATLGVQMRDMQNDLKCSIAEYGYDGTFDGTRQKMMDDIGAYTVQANMLLSLSPDQTATIAAIKAEMNTIASGYQSAHASINAFAMGNGSGGTRGALVNYSAKMKACGPIIGPKKSKALRAHYELMAAQQVMACTMVTNYYNGKDLKGLADAAAASCVTYLKELKTKEINAVIGGNLPAGWRSSAAVDSRTNRIWLHNGLQSISQYHWGNLYVEPRGREVPDGTVYLPGKKDLDTFLGDCYNANAAQFASCMAAKGWVGSNGEDMVTYSVYRSSFTDFHMSPYANGESRTAEQENRTLYCDYFMRDLGYPGVGIFANMKITGLVLGADGNPRLGAGCAKGTEANMLLFQTIPASKRYYN